MVIDKYFKILIGGLIVFFDYSLKDFFFKFDFVMLIIFGGMGWREKKNYQVKKLVSFCFEYNILVVVICDVMIFLGNYGFFDQNKYIGNLLVYLKEGVFNY